MIGFVYLWMDSGRNSTSHLNQRMFVLGSHRGSEDDGYITGTGGKRFKAAYRKRPQDFKRRIIERIYEGNDRTVFEAEQRWLNLIKPEELNQRYYNCKRTAFGLSREDILRILEADPTIKLRLSESVRNAHIIDPTLGKRRGEAIKRTYAADPTLGKRHGQARRDAHVADPTIRIRMSQGQRNAHAADPTLKPRLVEARRNADKANPTIRKRQGDNLSITLSGRTPEEWKIICEKGWATRRVTSPPSYIPCRICGEPTRYSGTPADPRWKTRACNKPECKAASKEIGRQNRSKALRGNPRLIQSRKRFMSQQTPEQKKARAEKIWASRRANELERRKNA